MRVKLYVLSLVLGCLVAAPLAIVSVLRSLGHPFFKSLSEPEVAVLMAAVGGATVGAVSLLSALLLGVRLEKRGGQLVLVERSKSPGGGR